MFETSSIVQQQAEVVAGRDPIRTMDTCAIYDAPEVLSEGALLLFHPEHDFPPGVVLPEMLQPVTINGQQGYLGRHSQIESVLSFLHGPKVPE